MTPLVSALIPAHNAATTIGPCLESLLAQELTEWEAIVVDDGSTDDTVAAAKALGDARIHVVRFEQNRGRAVARNHALRAARGEFVAVVDADDVSLPERFRLCAEHLVTNPRTTVVSGQVLHLDNSGTLRSVVRYPSDPEAINAKFARGKMGVSHAAAMFRREVALSYGGYLEDCLRAQDLELFRRMWRHGEQFRNLDAVILNYRNTPSAARLNFWLRLHKYHEYAVYRSESDTNALDFAAFSQSPWRLRRVYSIHLARYLRQRLR